MPILLIIIGLFLIWMGTQPTTIFLGLVVIVFGLGIRGILLVLAIVVIGILLITLQVQERTQDDRPDRPRQHQNR